VDIAADDRIVAAFFVDAVMVVAVSNLHMVEENELRIVIAGAAYADCAKDVSGLRTLKDQAARVGGATAGTVVRRALERYVGAVNSRGAVNHGDFARIIFEDDWFLRNARVVFHLIESHRRFDMLRINAASKTHCLASHRSIKRLLQGLPRFR